MKLIGYVEFLEKLTVIQLVEKFPVHMERVSIVTPYLSRDAYNITLLSTPRSSKKSLPLRHPDKNFVYISHFPTRTICPAYHILLKQYKF
jgi:hypothetical protein